MEKLGIKLRDLSNTKPGEGLIVLIGFGLAYLFFGLAVDKGNLWYYLLSIIFFVYGLKYLFNLLKGFFRGQRRR